MLVIPSLRVTGHTNVWQVLEELGDKYSFIMPCDIEIIHIGGTRKDTFITGAN